MLKIHIHTIKDFYVLQDTNQRKHLFFFLSFVLTYFWPFCHPVSVTCITKRNLLPRYVPQASVHFISGTKGCSDQGEAAPAGPCCAYTGFLLT